VQGADSKIEHQSQLKVLAERRAVSKTGYH
jgi:hypothetical protein